MHHLRFAWFGCPASGTLLHLAIYARKRYVAHWKIARSLPGTPAGKPVKGIWQQVQAANAPALVDAAVTGRCKIPGTSTESSACSQLKQALQTGRLLLQLTDSVSGATKTYSLIRVRIGGDAWLLNEVYYLPHTSAVPSQSALLTVR